MRRLCGPLFLVALCLSGGFNSLLWGGPYEGQIRLAPESTNLIVLVDVQALHNTPLAKSEQWMQRIKDAYLAGHALVPPTADRVVMLAEVDALDNLRPFWDLSVIDLYKAPDVLGFARNEQTSIEHLDGHRLIQTHTGALVLEVKTQRILASSLATRQMFSRCLKGSGEDTPIRLSPYLKKAADELPDEAQVVIGLDLANVFTRQIAQDALGKDASYRTVECVTSLKGLTCAVLVDKVRKVTIRLDFDQKVDELGSDPRKTLQPILKILGFSDEQLEIIRPTAHHESHAVIIKGELLPDRLLDLFRKFEATGTSQDYNTPPAPPENADPKQLMIAASQKYLASIQSLLDELKGTMRRDTIAEMSEKYAHKIDSMPMLNVDPDLLTFSANVSGSLRYQAQVKREAGLRTGVRASIPTYTARTFNTESYGRAYNGYGSPYYGSYGSYTSYRRDIPDTLGIAVQEQAPATQLRISEWRQIDDGMVAIRRKLTERYMANF
ncbi:MAG: hypothetical protein V4719_30095 [Planctomycetota bacterium]